MDISKKTVRDFLSELAFSAPVGMDLSAVLDAAQAAIEAAETPAAGVASARGVIEGARLRPLDEEGMLRELKQAAVRAAGLRLYGETDDAWAFYSGYLFSWDSLGHDIDFRLGGGPVTPAFYAGREANPEYPAHVAARRHADEALQAKFGDVRTLKAQSYWQKQYAKARAGKLVTA